MAAPTRAEIQGDATAPTFAVTVAGVDISAHVVSVRPVLEATGGEPSGVAMGPAVLPGCEIELFADSPATLQALRGYETTRPVVRASFGFATSDKINRFQGVLMSGGGDGRSRRWSCRGWDAHIEGQEVRSPLYRRRPIFTRTTAGSVENPATTGYAAGLGNFILWTCGGRPIEQAGTYPSATFYYGCTNALISPEFSWCPGDNPWDVLRRLCRAAGGQLYQDNSGVIRYVDPITLATGTPAFTFSDEVLTAAQRAAQGKAAYEHISDETDAGAAVTGVTANFVSRLIQGEQVVYEDSTPRLIAQAASVVVTCDTSLPLWRVTAAERDACFHRSATEATTAQVTIAYSFPSAQRVLVTLTNTTIEPVMIYAIRVKGRPLEAGEEGSGSYVASSSRVVTADDSPYVQSERHAAMLARMIYDGANNAGTLYTLGGCAYDPDRFVGEVVGLTSSDYGLTALRCRVVRIDVIDGSWMDCTLAPLGGLPTRDDVHICGAISGTKALAY